MVVVAEVAALGPGRRMCMSWVGWSPAVVRRSKAAFASAYCVGVAHPGPHSLDPGDTAGTLEGKPVWTPVVLAGPTLVVVVVGTVVVTVTVVVVDTVVVTVSVTAVVADTVVVVLVGEDIGLG